MGVTGIHVLHGFSIALQCPSFNRRKGSRQAFPRCFPSTSGSNPYGCQVVFLRTVIRRRPMTWGRLRPAWNDGGRMRPGAALHSHAPIPILIRSHGTPRWPPTGSTAGMRPCLADPPGGTYKKHPFCPAVNAGVIRALDLSVTLNSVAWDSPALGREDLVPASSNTYTRSDLEPVEHARGDPQPLSP